MPPLYLAVRVKVPVAVGTHVRTAKPFATFDVPRDLLLTKNSTVPVAVEGSTLAVRTTPVFT